MTNTETFLQSIENNLKQLDFHRQIAVECEVDDVSINLHDKVISILKEIRITASSIGKSINYLNQFQNDINQILNYFPYRQQGDFNFMSAVQKPQIKFTIESQKDNIKKQLELIEFNFSFFNKLGFFNNNIVAIGANGSGKTTLSNDLKKYLPNTGVVISAQKVMIIPTFSGVSNFINTDQKLQQSQTIDKSLKVTYSTENQGNSWQIMTRIGGEFQVLLDNLLAERSAIRNKFFDTLQDGKIVNNVPVTKLDKALKIWNSLIEHRILECSDGINITLKPISKSDTYPAHQMSDGEKVTLYLIAHILQAPLSGFIIIDEPEMYLHKTILIKLWDILEQERQDCIFIYLTHDLDFATSRTAKKVWIKSFEFPDKWEIEDIPNNDLPESLMFELLGSRKNILFCEGTKGSIDEKIYNLLFPNFTITPVGNCFAVINYTKAFNKLPIVTTKAFGLIDSDYHGHVRLDALKNENIYSFSMTEPENLFFDEDFLKLLSRQILFDDSIVEYIKSDVIKLLVQEKELQVSNYISTKINYYFKDSHVTKGNTIADVEYNYERFTDEIKIQDWYNIRKKEVEDIIRKSDYLSALSIFNNKGLKTIANKYLRISDFTDRAIKFLQFDQSAHDLLKKYFPNELKNKIGL